MIFNSYVKLPEGLFKQEDGRDIPYPQGIRKDIPFRENLIKEMKCDDSLWMWLSWWYNDFTDHNSRFNQP